MNKSILGIKKFFCNLVSSIIFWDKATRDSFRDKISPTNTKRCVKYLSRYTKETAFEKKDCKDGKYVWTCWLQGEDNAPEIVKKCFQSIRKNLPNGVELVIITYDNLSKYISLPDFITEKYQKHIITNTHLSDIIRVYLLKEYGGFWIDATCLLTSPLPEKIYNSDFFIYRSFGKFAKTFINSCFIYSKSSNELISKWAAAITEYWRKENLLLDYFTLHYLFISLLENDKQFKSLYDSYSLNETDENMHIIYRIAEKGGEITDTNFKNACSKTFIHKLTYKSDIKLPEILF